MMENRDIVRRRKKNKSIFFFTVITRLELNKLKKEIEKLIKCIYDHE